MFPALTEAFRMKRLTPPAGKVRMVLDTDAYNEIDDQFAIVHALLSPERIQVEAIYAAPFFNELSDSPLDGMEKSYREIQAILALMNREDVPVYKGSDRYLPGAELPVDSEAARNLVQRAMASSPEDPLYVAAIGAITNVASALLMEPEIMERIVVVWLGGHALHWPDTVEFNLIQDIHAARIVLNSGVPLVLLPCRGMASHLHTTLAELKEAVQGCGPVGDYLCETFKRSSTDHLAYSRVIWDLTATAWLVQPDWLPGGLVPSPVLSEDGRFSSDYRRHSIRIIRHVERNRVFRDLFTKIRKAGSASGVHREQEAEAREQA